MVKSAEFRFAMPRAVRITSRSSSITNSFVNGIIPVLPPSASQIDDALKVLDMEDTVSCAYCGDAASEWDHLRPLVVDKKPTGYISEIQNLVPACGKCNQSKGNKPWRSWMFSAARLSPATRGVPSLEDRASRLAIYESSGEPTFIDFAALAGEDLWAEHWGNHAKILVAMRHAELTAGLIRLKIAESRTDAGSRAMFPML